MLKLTSALFQSFYDSYKLMNQKGAAVILDIFPRTWIYKVANLSFDLMDS